MDGGDAFIAEIAIDFKHALESADNQPFEVEFRRDAQVEVRIERVVVRDERAGRGPAGNGLHHRRFHFEEPVFGEIGADARHDPAAGFKHGMDVRVGDQVHVALPVPGFDVRQAVPLFRKGTQPFRQKRQRAHFHGQLVGFRAEQPAFHPDPIAQIQFLRQAKGVVSQHVFFQIDLEPVRAVLERGKRGLAEPAQRHDASRDAAVDCPLLEVVFGRCPMRRQEAFDPVRRLEAGTVRLNPHGLERVEFVNALRALFVRFIHQVVPVFSIVANFHRRVPVPRLCQITPSIPLIRGTVAPCSPP